MILVFLLQHRLMEMKNEKGDYVGVRR